MVAITEKIQLPNGWVWTRLEDVTTIVSGTTPKTGTKEYWDGNIVWITPTDLGRMDDIYITDSERRISQEGFDSCNLSMLPINSVVLSSRAPIGHLAISKTELCTNQGCKSFIPSSLIDTHFLYYALKLSVPKLQELGSGATFTEISKSQLSRFEIPLPPLSEQKRIVKILNEQLAAVQQARQAAEARLEAAQSLPNAYLREVFSPTNLKKWPRKSFDEVAKIEAKQVNPTLPEYRDLPHVNGENIESGTCKITYLNTAAEEQMISGKYLFPSGSVLYSKLRPYLRKVALADFEGLCSADMYPIEVDKNWLSPDFTAWLLLSEEFTNYAISQSQRARMPKLNRNQLFAWEAPIPALKEQEQIIKKLKEQLKSAEQLRLSLETQLNELNAIPASLLRKAFQGEL